MEFIHTLKSDKVRGIARVRLVKNSSPTLPASLSALRFGLSVSFGPCAHSR